MLQDDAKTPCTMPDAYCGYGLEFASQQEVLEMLNAVMCVLEVVRVDEADFARSVSDEETRLKDFGLLVEICQDRAGPNYK
jgi:hypothetical protein